MLSVVRSTVPAVSTDLDALRRYAADHHGVVTGAAAAALGVRAVELLDLVLAGELALITNDVYRHYDFVTPLTEYAEAVALAGPGAVLADDAVLAMHDLAQVNPRRLRVAVPHPLPDDVRLPATVEVVVRELTHEDVTAFEGIPTMTVAAALRACRGWVMTERLRQGVHRAAEEGLLDPGTAAMLQVEFDAPALREQIRRNVEAEYALQAEFRPAVRRRRRAAGRVRRGRRRAARAGLAAAGAGVRGSRRRRRAAARVPARPARRPAAGHRRRAAVVRRPAPRLGAGAVVHRRKRLGRRATPRRRARQRAGAGRAGGRPPGRGAAVSQPRGEDRLTREQVRSLLRAHAVAGRVVADPYGTRTLAREDLRRMRAVDPRAAVWLSRNYSLHPPRSQYGNTWAEMWDFVAPLTPAGGASRHRVRPLAAANSATPGAAARARPGSRPGRPGRARSR